MHLILGAFMIINGTEEVSDISQRSGIMVLCKACDKYLELLSGNENNSLTSDERIMSEKDYIQKDEKTLYGIKSHTNGFRHQSYRD